MRTRSVIAAATAVVLGFGLSGCGADTTAARKATEKVSAPAADWKPGGQGIDRFGDDDKLSRTGSIWTLDDGDDPTFLAGWKIVVKPGFEGNRCEQAARWLKKTGQNFTGNAVDSQKKASLENIVVACLAALKPQADGATATTGFASWPAVSNDGYRFSAALGADVSGSVMTLYTIVESGPGSRYGD